MGGDTLKQSWWDQLPSIKEENAKRIAEHRATLGPYNRMKANHNRHPDFVFRDVMSQIKFRLDMNQTVDNKAASGLVDFLLDKPYKMVYNTL